MAEGARSPSLSELEANCKRLVSSCTWVSKECIGVSEVAAVEQDALVNPAHACESVSVEDQRVSLSSPCEWRGTHGPVEKADVRQP